MTQKKSKIVENNIKQIHKKFGIKLTLPQYESLELYKSFRSKTRKQYVAMRLKNNFKKSFKVEFIQHAKNSPYKENKTDLFSEVVEFAAKAPIKELEELIAEDKTKFSLNQPQSYNQYSLTKR